jgi:hypothetical protein
MELPRWYQAVAAEETEEQMTTETRREAPDATRITRAWQEGAQTLFSGYGEQWRRMTELGSAWFQPLRLDRSEVRETVERIAQSTRDVANAQVAVAGEWLRAPFWLTGAASPVDLQTRYVELFDAQRELVRAYLDAALGWQRALAGRAERAADVTREAVDAQTRTAKAVANDVREAQQASVDATRATVQRVADSAVETARRTREVAEEAVERAELAVRPIKGTTRGEEKIYHLPGQSSYERTEPDVTFATEEEARNAGFRRAQTPGGGRIKGNINREGERIYHLPGQANYDRVEAEFLFETEEQAKTAGFRASQR